MRMILPKACKYTSNRRLGKKTLLCKKKLLFHVGTKNWNSKMEVDCNSSFLWQNSKKSKIASLVLVYDILFHRLWRFFFLAIISTIYQVNDCAFNDEKLRVFLEGSTRNSSVVFRCKEVVYVGSFHL